MILSFAQIVKYKNSMLTIVDVFRPQMDRGSINCCTALYYWKDGRHEYHERVKLFQSVHTNKEKSEHDILHFVLREKSKKSCQR